MSREIPEQVSGGEPEWQAAIMPSKPTQLGDLIDGRYLLLDILGSGGMGEVFLAIDEDLQREVALKVPFRQDQQSLKRLGREALALSRFKTVHVVGIYDFARTNDGTPYIVMELLGAKTLRSRVEEGNLSIEETVDLFLGICEAVQSAHMMGLCHRDLKPENILIESRLRAVVIDWGAVFGDKRDDGRLTQEGRALGTPAYMAPERLEGKGPEGDGRSDQYSLGCLLYLALSGVPAFDLPDVDTPQITLNVRTRTYRPLAEVAPHLPPALIGIVERAMAYKLDGRYSKVRYLARDLSQFASPIAREIFKDFLEQDPPGVHGNDTGLQDIDNSLLERAQRTGPGPLPFARPRPGQGRGAPTDQGRQSADVVAVKPTANDRVATARALPSKKSGGSGRRVAITAVAVVGLAISAGALMARKRVAATLQPSAVALTRPVERPSAPALELPAAVDPGPAGAVSPPGGAVAAMDFPPAVLPRAADAAAAPSPATIPGLTDIHVPASAVRGLPKKKPVALAQRSRPARRRSPAPAAKAESGPRLKQLDDGSFVIIPPKAPR
jgi:hypothetical protein